MLLEYLGSHDGTVRIGNADTLEAAKSLQEEGILHCRGAIDHQPIFSLTEKGWGMVKVPTRVKVGKRLQTALGMVQKYSDSMKDQHQVGFKDLDNIAGLSMGDNPEFNAAEVYGDKPRRKDK